MLLTSVLSIVAGALLVHSGNHYALQQRRAVLQAASQESTALEQFRRGNRISAAALDAAGNAAAGLITMVAGFFPPAGFVFAAHRGWIGGIVAVDDQHRSRLGSAHEAFYYVATLILQTLPYSLVAAAGVNLGIAAFMREDRTAYAGPRVPHLRIPYEAIRDAGWIWVLSLPLFALASLFEFMVR